MMEKAIEARVKMGEASVPQFQPMLDGVFALAVLLEQLAAEKAPLSLAARAMPRSYMTRRLVDCPWQSKGRVMRHLIEETDNENVQLIDGIKVYTDQGWTLILPDSEDPVFHVYSEAASQEIAEEIAGVCISRIAEAMGDAE
jgi:mannose-1-phosphate guanylyltransferase/phosphomannomutase